MRRRPENSLWKSNDCLLKNLTRFLLLSADGNDIEDLSAALKKAQKSQVMFRTGNDNLNIFWSFVVSLDALIEVIHERFT